MALPRNNAPQVWGAATRSEGVGSHTPGGRLARALLVMRVLHVEVENARAATAPAEAEAAEAAEAAAEPDWGVLALSTELEVREPGRSSFLELLDAEEQFGVPY